MRLISTPDSMLSDGAAGRFLLAALVALTLALTLAGCGVGSDTPTTAGTSSAATTSSTTTATTEGAGTTASLAPGGQRSFTLEELAEFDGRDGRAAYVAVDGVVYDVTSGPDWQEGVHTRCGLGAEAGKDLSQVIAQAPANMRALLQTMPVVGRLVQ